MVMIPVAQNEIGNICFLPVQAKVVAVRKKS